MERLVDILVAFVAGGFGGIASSYLKYKAEIKRLSFEVKQYEDKRKDDQDNKKRSREEMDKHYHKDDVSKKNWRIGS